jgi:hypothetical protein
VSSLVGRRDSGGELSVDRPKGNKRTGKQGYAAIFENFYEC